MRHVKSATNKPAEAIDEFIQGFTSEVADGRIQIYNEISLQLELGVFLRSRLPDCRIEFERNVTHFFRHKNFTKREIDIVILDTRTENLLCAIELKFPRSGQVPEQMFSFCKDIAFLEELTAAGFGNGIFVAFADNRQFFQGRGTGVYGHFRERKPIQGTIRKPTGQKKGAVAIRGTYFVDWEQIANELHWTSVHVSSVKI